MPVYLNVNNHMTSLPYIVPDVDECIDGTDGCEELCTNTIGDYECHCREGFELDVNGLNCNGEYIYIDYYNLSSNDALC